MIGVLIQIMQRPYSVVHGSKDVQSGPCDLSIEQLQDLVGETFKDQKVSIWLAPSEGLYLQDLYFTNYNTRKIIESLELTSEEEKNRSEWCQKNIVAEIKKWVCDEDCVYNWLLNQVKWDTLERVEGNVRTDKEGLLQDDEDFCLNDG